MTQRTVGQYLFDYLHGEGIENAFGIPGDFVLPTYRHLQASPINIYTMTHEPSVAFAADCYARSKGLGLAVVTYSVGGLNMLNGIACAYAEKSPVIVVSGGPSPSDRHKDAMFHHKVRHYDSQKRIYEEVTCASTILDDPATAAEDIARVVQAVKTHSQPGYIEIPFDVTDKPIQLPREVKDYRDTRTSDPEVLTAMQEEIKERIAQAERPVIIAGIELHRFKLSDYASAISKKFNIPIAATLLGKSVVRETNPNYIGVYSGAFSEPFCRDYVENSDCIILLGAFVSDVLLGFHSSKLDRKKMIIIQSERMRVGFHAYEDILLTDALRAIEEIKTPAKPATKNAYQDSPAKASPPLDETALTSNALFGILSQHLTPNHSLVCDTGDSLIGAIGIKTSQRKHFFSDAYYLSMGFAVPASIGAMIADPGSRCVVIVGDGAFQMTGMELSTCAKYGLKPIIIVINNDGYGTQRHIVDGPFNDITRWEYHKVTDVVGYGKGIKTETNIHFNQALKEAFSSNTLYLIEAVIDHHDCSDNLRQMGEALGKLRRSESTE